jgi:hypothetical protein
MTPNPFGADRLYWLEHPGKHLDDIGSIEVRTLLDNTKLLRQSSQVPFEVFRQEALAIPSGFIMPGQLPLSHLCDFV